MHLILKYFQFFIAASTVCLSKLWHDSFRSYLAIAIGKAFSTSYMLLMHRCGLMIGGAFAGIFTDAYTPKRSALLSLFMIGSLSMIMSNVELLKLITFGSKHIVYFLTFTRGIFIGSAANSGYALIGQIFENDKFLGKATSILYLIMLCSLTFFPLLIKYWYSKEIFIFLSFISLSIFLCGFILPKREIQPLKFLYSIQGIKLAATNLKILLSALMSMIFVGGFYNLTTILKSMTLHTLEEIQFIGRLATTATLLLLMIAPITYNITNKDRKYYAIASLIMSLPLLIIIIPYSISHYINYNLAIISFILTCIGSAIAQPVLKSLMLLSANEQSEKIGRNLCGNAQSFLTFSDIFIETVGAKFIQDFGIMYYSIAILLIVILLIVFIMKYRLQAQEQAPL